MRFEVVRFDALTHQLRLPSPPTRGHWSLHNSAKPKNYVAVIAPRDELVAPNRQRYLPELKLFEASGSSRGA